MGNTAFTNSPLVCYTNLSPNITSPRHNKITRITIHCFVGQVDVKRGCDVFADSNKNASCNYVVAKDGKIGLVANERDRSWCSSNRDNDNRAITIEVASDTKAPYLITEKAYKGLVDLVEDICKRNGKKTVLWFADKEKSLTYEPKDDEIVFTVHRWFANKACPGDYIFSKLGVIRDEVNKRFNPNPAADEKIYHVVAKGESLSKIAKMYGVNWKDVAKLNNIKAPFYIIKVGQKLQIT